MENSATFGSKKNGGKSDRQKTDPAREELLRILADAVGRLSANDVKLAFSALPVFRILVPKHLRTIVSEIGVERTGLDNEYKPGV